ncbi:MAG: DUF3088 domain-containing protein [Chitinivibrionales bacterium]|nr:DUF3088 domain-containing protein [Chitinivibrionales bacterium]
MARDILFLLKTDFMDNGKGPYYCPDCLMIEGMLSCYPRLREELDIHCVDFLRPRPEIIRLIGEENQSVPVLIVTDPSAATESEAALRQHKGVRFINDESTIRAYLSKRYKIGISH